MFGLREIRISNREAVKYGWVTVRRGVWAKVYRLRGTFVRWRYVAELMDGYGVVHSNTFPSNDGRQARADARAWLRETIQKFGLDLEVPR